MTYRISFARISSLSSEPQFGEQERLSIYEQPGDTPLQTVARYLLSNELTYPPAIRGIARLLDNPFDDDAGTTWHSGFVLHQRDIASLRSVASLSVTELAYDGEEEAQQFADMLNEILVPLGAFAGFASASITRARRIGEVDLDAFGYYPIYRIDDSQDQAEHLGFIRVGPLVQQVVSTPDIPFTPGASPTSPVQCVEELPPDRYSDVHQLVTAIARGHVVANSANYKVFMVQPNFAVEAGMSSEIQYTRPFFVIMRDKEVVSECILAGTGYAARVKCTGNGGLNTMLPFKINIVSKHNPTSTAVQRTLNRYANDAVVEVVFEIKQEV